MAIKNVCYTEIYCFPIKGARINLYIEVNWTNKEMGSFNLFFDEEF